MNVQSPPLYKVNKLYDKLCYMINLRSRPAQDLLVDYSEQENEIQLRVLLFHLI